MRSDPRRLEFEIDARDGAARTGRLLTAHGPVATPAFIPLATKGAVRTLDVGDVAGLGFELILGNTFHLFISPGAERIAELGGLHRFMGWERALITDSGGFQVFSLAHGNVADEIKGRRGGAGGERRRARDRRARGALPLLPRRLGAVHGAGGVDGRCRRRSAPTSRSSSTSARPFTPTATTPRARPSAPTAGSTAASPGTPSTARPTQAVFGIVQGGVHEDLRRESARGGRAPPAVDGLAIGGTLGRDKPEMHGVLAMTAPLLPPEAPKHLLGIGEPDDLLAGIALGIDVFDCAVPTRLARHGMALAPLPESRFRFDVDQGRARRPTRGRWSRAARARPAPSTPAPTSTTSPAPRRRPPARLLTLHNLTFLERLVAGAREAIEAGRFDAYRERVLAGAAPWAVAAHARTQRRSVIRARADAARATACSRG